MEWFGWDLPSQEVYWSHADDILEKYRAEQLEFLEYEINSIPPDTKRLVLLTHIPPFMESFDEQDRHVVEHGPFVHGRDLWFTARDGHAKTQQIRRQTTNPSKDFFQHCRCQWFGLMSSYTMLGDQYKTSAADRILIIGVILLESAGFSGEKPSVILHSMVRERF